MNELDEKQAGEKPRRVGILGKEIIGPPACPILYRWTLIRSPLGRLMLHRFLPNADDRADHDHPAAFWTLVLRGGYDDRVPCPWCNGINLSLDDEHGIHCHLCANSGEVWGDRMRPGMLRKREATYRHRTRVLPTGCWTIVWMGRKVREWGFWRDGRWWPWREHERRFGFGMRCPERRP